MKKTYLKSLKVFLTLLLLCGVSNAWGEETVVYTLDTTDKNLQGSNNSYAGNCDITSGDITWNFNGNSQMSPWRIGGKNISNTERTVYTKTAFSQALTKVNLTVGTTSKITVNSVKLVYSTNSEFSSSQEISETFEASSDISFQPNGGFPANCYYKFIFNVTNSTNDNGYVQFSKVEFYVEAGEDSHNITIDSNIQNGTVTSNTAKAGEGTTISLTATPNAGYTFGTWDVYKTGETTTKVNVSDDKFEMPAYDVTVSATFTELPKHTVTISQPEGATLKINGETNPVELHEGETADISYELTPGYSWDEWTVSGIGASVKTKTAKNTTFTMGTENATLSALVTKLPVYTVTFVDKGIIYASKSVYQTQTYGDALSDVEDPTNDDTKFADFSFMGWSITQNTDDPSFISDATPVTSNTILYAIYGEAGSASYTKVDAVPDDWSGTYLIVFDDNKAHATVSGKDFIDTTDELTISDNVIAADASTSAAEVVIAKVMDGEILKGYSIQLPSGDYYKCSSGSNDVSKTPYALQIGTLDKKSGFAIASGAFSNTPYILYHQTSYFRCYTGKETDTKYKLPDLYKKSGAAGEYSLEGELVQPAAMTSTGYATFSSEYALDLSNLPEGLTAYKATTAGNGKVHMVAVEEAVAANTGLFLEGAEGETYTIPVAASGTALDDNILKATTGEALAEGNYVYVIANNAFQPLGKATVVSKGKAYIPKDAITTSGKLEISFGEPTGITSYENDNDNENIYNLNGVRVNGNYKGIVIMNGKKYINK